MTDPYSTFDTFTVGSESEPVMPEPSKTPPLIARLPKISPLSQPTTRKRFDEAQTPLPEAHLNESLWEQSDTLTETPPSAYYGTKTTSAPGNPTATIRIDTVSPGMFEDRPTAQPVEALLAETSPATIPFEPLASEAAPAVVPSVDEPWTAWMLDIESTIQPYARWIALAAVIAAMGLTVVLLRSSGGAVEAIDTAPQVFNESISSQALVGDYETKGNTGGAPPFWPTNATEEPAETAPAGMVPTYAADEQGLRPLEGSIAGSTPPPVAAGPASAARAPSAARFTGQILPAETSRIDVADAKYNTATPGTIR